jgi:hypothetical protein
MRGSQSSATQVDDRRKTSKRAVILPQAMSEVQAIHEEDQEKFSEKMAKTHRSNCLVHRRTIGFVASWTSEDERLRAPVASAYNTPRWEAPMLYRRFHVLSPVTSLA